MVADLTDELLLNFPQLLTNVLQVFLDLHSEVCAARYEFLGFGNERHWHYCLSHIFDNLVRVDHLPRKDLFDAVGFGIYITVILGI